MSYTHHKKLWFGGEMQGDWKKAKRREEGARVGGQRGEGRNVQQVGEEKGARGGGVGGRQRIRETPLWFVRGEAEQWGNVERPRGVSKCFKKRNAHPLSHSLSFLLSTCVRRNSGAPKSEETCQRGKKEQTREPHAITMSIFDSR